MKCVKSGALLVKCVKSGALLVKCVKSGALLVKCVCESNDYNIQNFRVIEFIYIYIYFTSLYNVPLLTSVDVVPVKKTAGVVENSGHCIYSIVLKCF